MYKFTSLFFLILVLSINSVTAQDTQYATRYNIPYYAEEAGIQDSYRNERCVLDIYFPENTKDFATVVWFHGGGLTGGNKDIPEALKNKGLCVVAVNYRLAPQITAPAYIQDAAAAVAWVFNNITAYGGNTSLIFVAGHSAGGYLTMMIGLDKQYLAAHHVDADSIAGLIPFSGQAITHFSIRKERQIDEKQAVVDHYAPLFHVRSDAPPMLQITGDRELEMLGRYEENAYLARMMKVAGHTQTRLIELQGYGHDMAYPAFPLLLNEISRIKGNEK